MKCINKKHKEFKNLLNSSNYTEEILSAKIAIWQEKNQTDEFPKNIFELISEKEINYQLSAVNILSSDKAKQIFAKGEKNNWDLNKILTELQIPKEQKQIILDKNIIDREEIITSLLANYSFAVEINTAREQSGLKKDGTEFKANGVYYYSDPNRDVYKILYFVEDGGGSKTITKEEFEAARQDARPTQHYSNLTVSGGTNYTENEIATPLITPSIKGHAQFSTDNGIGWFRSDDKAFIHKQELEGISAEDYWSLSEEERKQAAKKANDNQDTTKTRRILEVQSDLFQKGRDKDKLVSGIKSDLEHPLDIIEKSKQSNQFLQLLNKDNNWVTFFVKSIIQDSAKKGYEKVLFPTGNTASKVEGHTTLEEFKKQKEDRIKELENRIKYEYKFQDGNTYFTTKTSGFYKENITTKKETKIEAKEFYENKKKFFDKSKNEIKQLKQELERIETEGFGALKPIYNFYENIVKNVIKKNGYNPIEITDEYGNTWNEININQLLNNSKTKLNQETMDEIKKHPKLADETEMEYKQRMFCLGFNL